MKNREVVFLYCLIRLALDFQVLDIVDKKKVCNVELDFSL